MSAYQQVADAILAHLPDGWQFKPFEPVTELPDSPTATLKMRSVVRAPSSPLSDYQTEWVLTVTTDLTSRESADPTLADDLIDLLFNLDSDPALSWMGWTAATKVVGDDNERLAYDINITTLTQKEA